MIATSLGADLVALLDRTTERPERFKEVAICSPFIDEEMAIRLVRLLSASRRAHCGIRVITAPQPAELLRQLLPGHAGSWRDSIITHRRLHAKIYVAVARRAGESEAIVTSANLSMCGAFENIELGIRVLATSEPGRRILQQVHHFVRRIAA